jgi:hypothetical protein
VIGFITATKYANLYESIADGNIERSERLPALLSLGRVGRLALGAAARTDHPNSLAKLMRRRKPPL